MYKVELLLRRNPAACREFFRLFCLTLAERVCFEAGCFERSRCPRWFPKRFTQES